MYNVSQLQDLKGTNFTGAPHSGVALELDSVSTSGMRKIMAILSQKPFALAASDLKKLNDFNIQKNYIFNVIKKEVAESFERQMISGELVRLLDAASQNLLSRHIFPCADRFRYFGLDYDSMRFSSWKARAKSNTDRVVLADLTREISNPPGYEIVVSSNTLSHIHGDFWEAAFRNLFNFVRKGGDLFINFPKNPGWERQLAKIEMHFESFDILFYTTDASLKLGERFGGRQIPEIVQATWEYEARVENQSHGHHQVFVSFRNKITDEIQNRMPFTIFDATDEVVSLTHVTTPNKIVLERIEDFPKSMGRITVGKKTIAFCPKNCMDTVEKLLFFNYHGVGDSEKPVGAVQTYEGFESVNFNELLAAEFIFFFGLEHNNLPTMELQRDARLSINYFKAAPGFNGKIIIVLAHTWFGMDTSSFTDVARFA